jgi:3-hydroxyacyl-CoA dehydrogenase
MIDEDARILDEGIALRSGDIDVVTVNGYGLPRWRGGPMFMADYMGPVKSCAASKPMPRTTPGSGSVQLC